MNRELREEVWATDTNLAAVSEEMACKVLWWAEITKRVRVSRESI